MAVKFIESGGDADFGIGLWPGNSGSPTIVSDFVHGGHLRSVRFRPSAYNVLLASNLVSDAGGRFSAWFYIAALPTGTTSLFILEQASDGSSIISVEILSGGGLIIKANGATATTGSTLSTGTWYRISFAWKITSTTVNEFRCYLNGVLNMTLTNTTLANVTSADLNIGNAAVDATYDVRGSDFYLDNSNALTDPGNIWVTAKRPNANGTSNDFTTQIGSGGSGYGSGHSPQVNERPESDTNGWSIQNAVKKTEEYSIEGQSTGDINISGSILVDFMGWIRAKVGVNSTGNIIVAGVASNISVTTTAAYFKKIAGSSTYPAGNTDIGMDTNTVNQLFSLYECGIIFAYIPASVPTGAASWLSQPISQPLIANDIQPL